MTGARSGHRVRAAPPQPSEIASERVYFARRRFLLCSAALAAAWPQGPGAAAATCGPRPQPGALLPDERLSTIEEISGYNNFYEYSPEKTAIKHLAVNLRPRPWQLRIEGEVERSRTIEVDALLREFPSEDRIYRLRCVEGWSIVVPWQGFSLCALLAKAQPTSRAKYVRFVALHDPERFYGQRRPALPWPYTEALTIAEAMHPLTLLASGIYGKPMPNQNGAPIRLVVPWKYGFKSIKSLVTIRLEETRPQTTWPQVAPGDYGFYANVDLRVPLARFSHTRESRIGELQKRNTLPFNGYAEQVASLYAGIDPAQLR